MFKSAKKSNSHFARGSGLFTCRVCKRSTRATGNNDNEHVTLCVQCYELAGIENSFLDGCGEERDIAEARRLLKSCQEHGGKITEADFSDIPFTS